jgi:hypothetical protein
VTYLDELLAGYQQGLAGNPLWSIQALRVALAETDDAWQRGRLLGFIARTLAVRVDNRTLIDETPSRQRPVS